MAPMTKQRYYLSVARRNLNHATAMVDLLDDYRDEVFPPWVYEETSKEEIIQAGIRLFRPSVIMMLSVAGKIPRNHAIHARMDDTVARHEAYEQAVKKRGDEVPNDG